MDKAKRRIVKDLAIRLFAVRGHKPVGRFDWAHTADRHTGLIRCLIDACGKQKARQIGNQMDQAVDFDDFCHRLHHTA